MRKLRITLLIPLVLISSVAARAGTMSSASFGSFAGLSYAISQSTASSYSFGMLASAGEYGGVGESIHYRSYAGSFVPSQVIVQDGSISFMDEMPGSTEQQASAAVQPEITIETATGNDIAEAWYRVSSAGPDAFSPWRQDFTAVTAYSTKKKRYRVSLPNGGGDYFSATDNNYIQWRVKDTGNLEAVSSKYRIRVASNDAPSIIILQPDTRGGTAARLPAVKVQLADTNGGINASSIEVKIDRLGGSNVALVRAQQRPEIFTASTGLLSFSYDGTPLENGVAYRMTVSAQDTNGVAGSASVEFTVREGAIADLVPYPSPFDPKSQPVVIRYVLGKPSTVSINLYDISGRIVKNLFDGQARPAGIAEDTWDGRNYASEDLANGVYICEVIAKDEDGEHRRYTSLAIFGR